MNTEYFRSEKPIRQKYFSAPQIGKIVDETSTTIRFWALQFNVYRKEGGYRWLYPRESVALFHQIKTLLRVDKFTIQGAKQKLKIH